MSSPGGKRAPPSNFKIPGPGTYNPQLKSQDKNLAFSIRQRTKFGSVFTTPRKGTPGPGDYTQQSSITKEGKHFNSKYKANCSAVIATSSRRFDHHKKRITSSSPGPGAYKPAGTIHPEG